MSQITGKQFREEFKMRVVSGMLVAGSLQVTWATGQKASSQMDWGFDSSVPFATPEYHSAPQEMIRYHRLYFPQTYLDTLHFFRVRSRTSTGKIGLSPIYQVYVTEKLAKSSLLISEVALDVRPVPLAEHLTPSIAGLDSSSHGDALPEATADVLLAPTSSPQTVTAQPLTNQHTAFATTITSTII